MQDCRLDHKITYIFYIYTYYRKVLFGFAITNNLNG